MTNIEQINPMPVLNTDEDSSNASNSNILLILKVFEYLCLAAMIGSVLINIIFPEQQLGKIYLASFAVILFFLFLIEQQLAKKSNQESELLDLTQKAKLYTSLGGNVNGITDKFITSARVRALKYCHDLIADYKKTRRDCRNIYYSSQIGTIVLSGVTPILVLVDKLDSGSSWLKWLPVICPAIAAIVASIVTSFPFQENWVAANATVELLEAEQEKFVLGVSSLYQFTSFEETQLTQEAQKTVENFIVQVNNIHLKQLEAFNKKKQDNANSDQEKSSESAA